MGLTPQSIEVLTYMEQVYYETGDLATNEKLAEVVGLTLETIKEYWKDPDFRNAIAARGIMLDGVDDSKALTMPQLLVANMLMNPSDRRSMREKLKDPSLQAFQITLQQVNGWMRSSTFQAHLQKRAHALFGGAEPAAYKNFVSAIEGGDQKAIALYFEMKGIYNPRLQVDVNISSVLTRVVEIIAIHVKDPATLQRIANDLDGLDIGVPSTEVPELSAPIPVLPEHVVEVVEEVVPEAVVPEVQIRTDMPKSPARKFTI